MTKINNKLFSDNFLNIDNIDLYNDLFCRDQLNKHYTKIYNQTESDKKINQIKYRYLLYKSIFNNNQSVGKYNSTMTNPNSNKNFFSTNQESNNHGNLKLNQEISLNKINNPKAHDTFFNEYKYKKNLQNNGDNTNINNTGKNSHKKKKYFKYLLKNGGGNKTQQSNTDNSTKIKEFMDINTNKYETVPVAERENYLSCNKIIDKNEFIKKIKEIEDLDFSEEINKKKYTFFSAKENIKNIIQGNFFSPSKDRAEERIDTLKTIPKTSRIWVNKKIKTNNYKREGKNIIKQKNSINKIIRKDNLSKEKRNNLKDNIIHNSKQNNTNLSQNVLKIGNLLPDLYNKKNGNKPKIDIKNLTISTKNRHYNSSSFVSDLLNEKQININNKNDRMNKYKHTMEKINEKQECNDYIKNIKNNNENNYILELKETILKLKNVVKIQKNKINAFEIIVKNYKKQNDLLDKNNDYLIEENWKSKELINKYKAQIMILIKKQNIVDKESNGGKCKINYNDENNNDISLYKTKELENQIEKYKKEINSLKKLLLKYTNTNKEVKSPKGKSITNLNSSSQLPGYIRKKSLSVSRTRNNNLILSSKIFQEDKIYLQNN